MTHTYTFDAIRRIWLRPATPSMPYSDGDDAESYLLSVLRNAKDVSSTSPEMAAAIRDWPSEYHLSPIRHNLLRLLELGPAHRVLELGCGCGAITRFLGESGATVVAVEGSMRRAEIAAERCRDLSNVKVYCDNLIEFGTDEKFDYVTLIGVLEYAPQYIDSKAPTGACLNQARSFLKEDGVLVLAIENQLGLKYFNGCAEDHTGIPYFGIHGLYGSDTPITFGRCELKSRLIAAGFGSTTFYYPFPDYKIPNLILTDECLNHPNFHPADLFHRIYSRDYTGSTRRSFHESLAWRPLIRNGLLPELANSYLVLARKSDTNTAQSNWLARLYSTERLPTFATETVFQLEGDDIFVTKQPLFPQTPQHNLAGSLHIQHQPPPRTPYVPGRLYAAELQNIMARGGNLADVAKWAAPWVKHLATKTTQGLTTRELPGEWLDAIPANFVLDSSDNLVLIDVEWRAAEPIPLAWVLARGFIYTLSNCPPSPAIVNLTFRDLINQVLRQLKQPELAYTDYQQAAVLEDALQNTVYGRRVKAPRFAELIERRVISCISPPTITEENIALSREIDRIKSTASWQITKPLRLIANLPRLAKKALKSL